jgi:CBS domain-containing protein
MNSNDPTDTVECGIGVREILSGDGAVKRRMMVHCDPRNEAVYVSNCAACERCIGFRPPVQGQSGTVMCRRFEGEGTVTVEAGMRTPVRVVMERNIVCVRRDVSVETIAALLLEWGADGVPVVDEDGHPIGMISWTDLLREQLEAPSPPAEPGEASVADLALVAPSLSTAGDVMTPLVFSVVEGTELSRAAALMSAEGFQQLPVVMGDGSIGGLLSTRDVARWVGSLDRAGK